ncbi:MAG: hypothetical protein A3F54_02265 [Candidatus Kerfeldbacteria bacterium RIFCSPHIGHO2_12_FULL_48_17]|uniref:BACON domain-containing protein n=1 Tax=Candidatus Kerfeldbacteria bacterium RIFCSPHIGHO2_12_FULL_48_17 TaxID=1798542 RepID=A0A1G2AZI2_9BACT|nr:MAG: hypothetical protein A3F54_02265 [Candidatus Kerfeldbacteria bacterium RIFCSPHIGHO2_12_FULL_48_17]
MFRRYRKKIFIAAALSTALTGLSFWLSATPALAIGVGAKPSHLEMNFANRNTQTTEVIVFNLSDEAAALTIAPDELRDWITIEPTTLELAAQEHATVKVTITPQDSGQVTTNLSITAESLHKQGFNPASGIKIPINIQVQEKSADTVNLRLFISIGLGILALAIIVGMIGFFWYRKTLLQMEGGLLTDENLALQGKKRRWWE